MSFHRDAHRWNWGGNYRYHSLKRHEPRSIDELRSIVAHSKGATVVGTRHSFSEVADNAHDQISLRHLDRIELDSGGKTVAVQGGITYTQLAGMLHTRGLALHNLASLPHINVVGACATATHGSGSLNRNLSSAVSALELVTSTGDIVRLSRESHGERFLSVAVGLGGFGVIVSLTLDVEPAYTVSQRVYENIPFDQLLVNVDAIFNSAYSVSIFLDWQHEYAKQIWLKRRVTNAVEWPDEIFGGRPATHNVHPLQGRSGEESTEQLGQPGPWHERLPHFRADQTPSSGSEVQSEYFVARGDARRAIEAIRPLRSEIGRFLQVSELRVIRGDAFPLSPCFGRDSFAIHFTWKLDEPGVRTVLPLVEKRLSPYAARPHWGKVFTMPFSDIRPLYDHFDAWATYRDDLDPKGTFVNGFLARLLGREARTS